MKNFFTAVAEAKAEGGAWVISSLAEDSGVKVLLNRERILWKSAGCQFRESDILRYLSVFSSDSGKSRIVECDGVRWLCEPILPEERLIICGAGHVALSCLRMAKLLGMEITVLEDREEYANMAREAGADQVICRDFREALSYLEGHSSDWYLVMTRAHKMDQDCLQEIFQKPYAYVGMLGSPRKMQAIQKNLTEEGVNPKHFQRLHSPVGLDIGAKTPAEIGVSVMAELIQLRNQEETSEPAYSRKLLGQEVLHEKEGILCTLIDNGGGSPRNPGTKMMVHSAENCIGTIGGGVLEGAAIREAVAMLADGRKRHILRTHTDGEASGMACCGRGTVLLERL